MTERIIPESAVRERVALAMAQAAAKHATQGLAVVSSLDELSDDGAQDYLRLADAALLAIAAGPAPEPEGLREALTKILGWRETDLPEGDRAARAIEYMEDVAREALARPASDDGEGQADG